MVNGIVYLGDIFSADVAIWPMWSMWSMWYFVDHIDSADVADVVDVVDVVFRRTLTTIMIINDDYYCYTK